MRHLLFLLLAVGSISVPAADLSISWTNNMLRIQGPGIAGDHVDIWYLEAFCRSGSTHQDWSKTTIPHKTELLGANGHTIRLRTKVEPSVIVDHEIVAGQDNVDFRVNAQNQGDAFVDVQWFQPCMRVDRFTGLKQGDYIEKSFIYTDHGLELLSKLPRNEEAIYRGGQVYVPSGVRLEDVNPRPISSVRPANALIGCFSADGKQMLAMAWDQTQELFQGVIVCLHNDPRIGGLKPGERKTLHGKVYIVPSDPEGLVARFKRDFPASQASPAPPKSR